MIDTLVTEGGASDSDDDEEACPIDIEPEEDFQPENSMQARGREAILAAVRNLTQQPGVYRMLDENNKILYVGKAKNLKRRVTSYTKPQGLPNRTLRMVSLTRSMEFVVTRSEAEALLLEANLIKKLKPTFNIMLRDDKSFPFILLRKDHAFPQLSKHRGARKAKGDYFGPFASVGSVNRTLPALHRAFLLRSCSDSVFSGRSRPCLEYQIKRCSAPCVGFVSESDYQQLVAQAAAFLSGRSQDMQKQLSAQMEEASQAMEFEKAAALRDRLRALSSIQTHQEIHVTGLHDADVLAIASNGGASCVQVYFLRHGQNYGTRAFFPKHSNQDRPSEVLTAFVAQFYAETAPPPLILTNIAPSEPELLSEALSMRADRKVEILQPQRGDKKSLVDHGLKNAQMALDRKLAETASQKNLLDGVAKLFALTPPVQRIEVFDNSHVSGTHALGAMIVAGPEGFVKTSYRTFNIKSSDLTPGDDYAMMREVLTRRYGRLKREIESGEEVARPNLVLIDGGLGQLNVAFEVLTELGLAELIPVVGVAKGPDRDAGREKFFRPGMSPFQLPPNDPVLYYLQRLRDEAHRFAIGSHRAKRSKNLGRSKIDDVPGIGPKRKKALLHHFGAASAIERASIEDLLKCDGINRATAEVIFSHFHPD